jgi:citrate lyase subunit beta / citryl-CoA lyase
VDAGADVLIQELEDFTPPERRPEARAMSSTVLAAWRSAGCISAVRINPLEEGGWDDLEAVMHGNPDLIMMSKVSSADQVRALDQAMHTLEAQIGIPAGTTEMVPNVETAAGLVRTMEIAAASPRISGVLVAAEDMVGDLGAERTRSSGELAYVRSRFLVECVAAGVLAIDCPYTFADLDGAEADLRFARGLGYKAKSIVNAEQVPLVNRLLTPSEEEVDQARRIVEHFEAARSAGRDRIEVDGLMIEVPTYLAARRLLQRAHELAAADDRKGRNAR